MAFNSHTILLMKDGAVKSVGYNNFGQCATGKRNPTQLNFFTIPNLRGVKQVACGANYTMFLMKYGYVKSVGCNDRGQCGTENTDSPQLSLFTIPKLTGVKQVACGYNHTIFLMKDGTVKSVGCNDRGQCGTGNRDSAQLSLFTIPKLTGVKQVACGANHTIFLMKDGTVRSVGCNDWGQCGTGNTDSPRLSLFTIPRLTGVKQVACGSYYTMFLLENETIKSVGYNGEGQCGTGNTINPQVSLYQISNLNGVKQVTCGYNYTMFLMNNGNIKSIGYNGDGECGTENRNCPQLDLFTISNLAVESLSEFVLKEVSIKDYMKFLIQDKSDILYSYDDFVLKKSPSQSLDKNNFIYNGFNDRSLINKDLLKNKFESLNGLKLLIYIYYTKKNELNMGYNCKTYRMIDRIDDNFDIIMMKEK